MHSLFAALPDAVMSQYFLPSLNAYSVISFSRISFYAHNNNAVQAELEKKVKQLFHHILAGEKDKIKKMLEDDPSLVLVRWRAKHAADKTILNKAKQCIYIEGKTAFQLALGEGVTEIAKIIRACIVKEFGEKEANAQYYAQFPDPWEATKTIGWQQEEKERWAGVLIAQEELTKAVRDAKPEDLSVLDEEKGGRQLTIRAGSNVAIADEKFRNSIDAVLKIPVKTGRHFNPDPLKQALYTYADELLNHLGKYNWQKAQAMLLLRRIIGYNQRAMSLGYATAWCGQGLDRNIKILEKGEQISGSLKLRGWRYPNDPNNGEYRYVDFYDLTSLGLDFAIAMGGNFTACASQAGMDPRVFHEVCILLEVELRYLCVGYGFTVLRI